MRGESIFPLERVRYVPRFSAILLWHSCGDSAYHGIRLDLEGDDPLELKIFLIRQADHRGFSGESLCFPVRGWMRQQEMK